MMKRNRQRMRRRSVLRSRISITEREIAADLHFPAKAQIQRDDLIGDRR